MDAHAPDLKTALERFMALRFTRPVEIFVIDPEAGGIKDPDALTVISCSTWNEFVRVQRKLETGAFKAPITGLSPMAQLLAQLAIATGVIEGDVKTEAGRLLQEVLHTPISGRTDEPRGVGVIDGETTAERSRRRAREMREPIVVMRHSHINHCGVVVAQKPIKLCGGQSTWRYKPREDGESELCDRHGGLVATRHPEITLERIERKSLVELVLDKQTCRSCPEPGHAIVRVEQNDGRRPCDTVHCARHADEVAADYLRKGFRVTLLTRETATLWAEKVKTHE